MLIGAGSVEFTQILLSDLVEFPELVDSTITLHDIDAERLDTAERIAHLINNTAGTDLRIRATLDRRSALDGADFVVNEIQVGGLDASLRDFEIPKTHGLRRTRLTAGEPIAFEPEGELAPRYIHSLVTGQRRMEYGNVRNDGLIDAHGDLLPAGIRASRR